MLIHAATWYWRRLGRAADESLGIAGVGGVEDARALGVGLLGAAVVDGRWGHQADAGVAVLVVVAAAIGVHGEPVAPDLLVFDRLGDQRLGDRKSVV